MDTITQAPGLGEALEARDRLGRNFVDGDMTLALCRVATAYALHYEGSFGWLIEQGAYARRGLLSVPRARGVLNSAAADARRTVAIAARDALPSLTVEASGVYVLPDGAICKVQANRTKTYTYALRWTTIAGIRLTDLGTREHGEYVYEARLIDQVAAEGRKMTLSEARAFIIRYGQCCRCGRQLKDADSVTRGIGPVCIQFFPADATGADLMVAS